MSPSLSLKGRRKQGKTLNLDKGHRAPCEEPRGQAAPFPDFRRSFGGWWANNHRVSSEMSLLMGDREQWTWGEGERSAFETRSRGVVGQANRLVLIVASNSPLVAEARAEAHTSLLERWGETVQRLGKNLSCLSLLHPRLGQILASSRKQEWWTNISVFAAMLFKAPASFPLCFGQFEVVKIN